MVKPRPSGVGTGTADTCTRPQTGVSQLRGRAGGASRRAYARSVPRRPCYDRDAVRERVASPKSPGMTRASRDDPSRRRPAAAPPQTRARDHFRYQPGPAAEESTPKSTAPVALTGIAIYPVRTTAPRGPSGRYPGPSSWRTREAERTRSTPELRRGLSVHRFRPSPLESPVHRRTSGQWRSPRLGRGTRPPGT